MTRSMGTADRLVRSFLIAPAALVAALAVGVGSIAGVTLVAVAGIMLATSAVGFCPLYALLGVDTRGRRRPASA